MRAVLIDPFACQVRDYPLPDMEPGDFGQGAQDCLQAIYRALSHPTVKVDTIDIARIGKRDVVFVDGHGLVRPDPPCRHFRLLDLCPELLAGKGLALGFDDEGNECDTSYTPAELSWRTRFFEIIRPPVAKPGMEVVLETITPWEPAR